VTASQDRSTDAVRLALSNLRHAVKRTGWHIETRNGHDRIVPKGEVRITRTLQGHVTHGRLVDITDDGWCTVAIDGELTVTGAQRTDEYPVEQIAVDDADMTQPMRPVR
jgi:hypothetical protein